jgi:4-hydroxy-3-methylbut-2-enyl diphosphate reductase
MIPNHNIGATAEIRSEVTTLPPAKLPCMEVLLANPRGFCAGVDRAIEIVKRAIENFGAPIYVRHEVVHNRFVVDDLKQRGAVFVEELDEVPDGATVIFSAHGVSQAVRSEAQQRGLKVFDATCPLVTKVHMEVSRHCRAGRDVILIGHAGHPEVEGTMGQWRREAGGGDIHLVEDVEDVAALVLRQPDNVAYTTQTTLSVDDTRAVIAALRERFPALQGPRHDDICYATQNRQDAVRELAQRCDLVLVVGSANSSNSNRLRELAQRDGVTAYLIDDASTIDPDWLSGKHRIGVTAGASAPEVLVQGVLARLRELGAASTLDLDGEPEDMTFALPKELRLTLID